MKMFKGFDSKMQCRGFQYEVGRTYETDNARLCESGFHACEAPLDIWRYYPPKNGNQAAEVDLSLLDERREGDTKRAGRRITVGAKIDIAGLIAAQIAYTVEKAAKEGQASSGDYSTAASLGYGSTATSSGDSSTATSSGYGSTAASSGDRSIAMVAGLGGCAKAGQRGAFALPWLDGEQVRIAVGIVGENVKADTLYRVSETGQLLEAQS